MRPPSSAAWRQPPRFQRFPVRVFEDANFAGTASDYDGGAGDLALANVDVELYSNANAYITSTTTDGSGNFTFTGVGNGTYKVRVRSATIGDGNTPPRGTFNAACGITDPTSGTACAVAAQTWANGAAAYGGQSPIADDTATNNDAGPGNSWTSVVVNSGDVANVNFGFAYNLIVNTNDAGQGSLRQFVLNSNAIGAAAGTTANSSEFRIPLTDPNYNAGLGAHTITLASALATVTDDQTVIDGQTQTDNIGNTNAADFTHPFYGAAKSVGTGVDGIAATGDEFTLPAYPNPEIEINGSDVGSIFLMTGNGGTVRRLAMYNASPGEAVRVDAGTANIVEDNYIGTRADGTDPGAGLRLQHGLELTGGSSIVRNNLVAYSEAGGSLVAAAATVSGNEYLSNALLSANGDAISTETSSGQAITIRDNRFHDTSAYSIETWNSTGPFVLENNTISDTGTTGPNEIGGIRIFGSGSSVRYNIVSGATGAGIVVVQTGGSNSQNLVSRNSTFANGGLGIDIEATDFVSPDGDGVTPNNGAMNAGLPNNEMDYPVITLATLSGTTLHLEGYVGTAATKIAAVHTLEFYKAANDGNNNGEIEAGDALNVPHGEGQTFIDSCTTAASGNFICDLTVPAAVPLAVGESVTAIAIDSSSNTSEFGANAAITNPVFAVSGRVFEDTAGNALAAAESIGDGSNPVVSGADVYLYADDGATPGVPDATDSVQNGGSPFVTNGSGVFSLSVPDGSYWVVVDSRSVSPSAGVHPSYLATTPWAEQTYGPDNGWCSDVNGNPVERTGAGPCYGGAEGADDDDAAALTTAEHIARVVVAGGAVTNVNFGFSYNVVTNVAAAGAAGLTASTYQGSLDQFIRNANAINGANALRFVPAVPTNGAGGGGTWWRINYTGAAAGTTPTEIHDADTVIDGTAFNLSNGTSIRNTNPGSIGANAGGGLTVGVDGIALPQVPRPELEVMRSDNGVGTAFYFYSNLSTGQTPNNFTVRDVAAWGFVESVGMTGIAGARPSGVVIQRNVFGSAPDAFADPAVAGTLRGVALLNADNVTVSNNLIGFVDAYGVSAGSVTATTISGNEIRETAQVDTAADAINYGGGSTSGTISGNLIVTSGGIGVDGTATGNLIENNSVSGAGQLGVQTAGIRQTGSGNTIRRNVLTGNVGPGVIVPSTVNANVVSENVFGNNGGVAIDGVAAGGANATGDGVSPNDGATDTNDGNDGLDFPVIDSAVLGGGNITVTGFARAGVTIEFYAAVGAANDNNGAGNPHGEGTIYLQTRTEGVADADATTGASYSDPGFGADANVNRFSFTIPSGGFVSLGDQISATATDATGNTSEFGPNATLINEADLVVTKVLDPATPGPFAEGDAVTYLITVTNNGPATATNVTATDSYPAELTLGTAVPSAPTAYAPGTGVWTIGTLSNGASATLSLPGTVNAGTAGDVVTNSITAASADQTDPTTAGDDLVETFTVLPFLSIDDVAQVETNSTPGTTTFTFTVSINQAIGSNVTFNVDTADGTATTANSDYVAVAGGSGTILAGATTTTIDVTVNGDDVVEADETFFVNLSSVVGAAVADAQGQGTITNDDSATVAVAGTTDGNETGPVNGQFTVTQSAISDVDTVISYTVGGTATAGGTDYTSLSGSVTILAGATSATIDVTGIVADALIEGSETVVVTLTGTGNPAVTVAASPNDSASINILDGDAATVSVAATTDGNEAGPVNGVFTVTQSAVSASNTVITYTIGGTATAGGTDYTTLSGSVTVLAGATTANIDVTGIVADSLVEGSETVIVTLTGTSNVAVTVAASPNDSATISILDADTATVSIAGTTNANEAGPVSGQFTVTQTTASATNTVITYTVGGTATAGGTDYTSLSGSVTVLAGATTATIDVTGVVADALVEGTETVVVTITGTDNAAITVAASPNDSASIDILDANSATVSVSGTTDANEAGAVNGQFTVTQSALSAANTVISYTVGGTATAGGTDYTSLSGSVTVLAGATTATIDVTGIVTDAIVEGSETVIVTLTGTDNAAISVAASPNDTASIDILDANTAVVSIAGTTDANETGAVNGQFTVTQSATSASNTIVSYTIAGTATAGGTDYTTLSGSVTVLAGATTAVIDVTGIVADSLIEGSETVVVTLTGTDNAAVTVAASPNDSASINILDGDSATVSVAGTTNGNESGPVNGQFTVTQSANSATNTVITYTVAGTATAGGTDYASLSGSVTVLAGASTATIDVTGIVADALIEGSETVIVTLTGTDNAGISVAASPNDSASIDILDGNSAAVAVAGYYRWQREWPGKRAVHCHPVGRQCNEHDHHVHGWRHRDRRRHRLREPVRQRHGAGRGVERDD